MSDNEEIVFETDKQVESMGKGFAKLPKRTLFEDKLEELIVKIFRGYIKDKDQARYIVIALVCFLFLFSIFLFFK